MIDRIDARLRRTVSLEIAARTRRDNLETPASALPRRGPSRVPPGSCRSATSRPLAGSVWPTPAASQTERTVRAARSPRRRRRRPEGGWKLADDIEGGEADVPDRVGQLGCRRAQEE